MCFEGAKIVISFRFQKLKFHNPFSDLILVVEFIFFLNIKKIPIFVPYLHYITVLFMRNLILIFIGLHVCIDELPAQSFEEFVEKSFEYAAANDLVSAEVALKSAMRLEPANRLNYALLFNLGTYQRRQKKYDDALFSYSAALHQMPHNVSFLLNRAELLTEMGETEKAIGDYNVLLDRTPTHEEARFQRGLLYIHTGDYLMAEADFEYIIKTHENTFLGRFGYAILEKVRGNYDDSEVIFLYLADKYPNNIRLLEERAELYFLTKRFTRATSDLNKVFAATPEPSAELYMLRGRLKLAQYERESAAIDFRKARDLGYDPVTVERLLKECF